VATGATSSTEDIQKFILATLLHTTNGYEAAKNATLKAIEGLNMHGPGDGFIL
jgi:hypothetical protein